MDTNDVYPYWGFPIEKAHSGIKLGTPRTGLLVWGGGRELVLSIGVPDLWDHDGGAHWRKEHAYANIRRMLETGDAEAMNRAFFAGGHKTPQLLPFGRITLRLPKGVALDRARLDVRTGALFIFVKGAVKSSIRLCVDRGSGCVVASFGRGLSGIVAIPRAAYYEPANTDTFRNRGIEPPKVFADGFEQPMPHDDAAALGIVRRGAALFAMQLRGPAGRAHAKAIDAAAKCADEGARAIFARTAAWWRDYWADVPRVSVPNAVLQAAYDYGMYQFGSATGDERGSTVAPLQGPWYADDCIPPWGGDYHFNINLQEYYWPAFHGNRLEHLRPVFAMLKRWMPKLRDNARVFAGIDDGIMLPHAVDDRGTVMTAAFWTGMMDHGSTMWMADFFWKYYAYGGRGGLKFLREEAMPFMEGAFNVFWTMLDHCTDGSLALPVGPSPEYRGANLDAWGRNTSFQLAAAHRLAQNLIDAAKALRRPPDPRWTELRDRLPLASIVDSSTLGKGESQPDYGRQIGLWDGLIPEMSHRHHSHLAGIFPFETIPLDDPEWRKLVGNSFATWIHHGPAYWSGWCVPWAAILHARAGNAEAAEFTLEFWDRFFVNEGRGTRHNANAAGISMMGQPPLADRGDWDPGVIQFDAAGGATMAVLEMLCHERDGVLHVFEGAPCRWRDVSFDGIRISGGVLVGARRRGGKVVRLELRAVSGAASVKVADPRRSGAIVEVALRRGETVSLCPR